MSVVLGFVIGIGGILIGHIIDDGEVSSLIQGTAAFIVFGGTLGAVIVSCPQRDITTAIELLKSMFTQEDLFPKYSKILVDAANIARKESILSLEKKLPGIPDPFMKNVLRFMIDGVDPGTVREVFETEIRQREEQEMAGARVFMDAGGYSPTIGIIGAVLGLIHVMQNLTDTSKLGSGIAVAFVATIYGVGSANLIFIPLGTRLKKLVSRRTHLREMILSGGLSIANGLNPHIIEEKLESYWSNMSA